jgi:hypothetical protein
MKYTDYQYYHLIPEVLRIAQTELNEYLLIHEPTEFADLTWFEQQYGHELLEREDMKRWYAVPNLRAGTTTIWSDKLPKLTNIAMTLPGIVNFSLNAISPHGRVPTHSDYTYDMRKDLSGVDRVYVILLAVDIPGKNIEECGFHIGDEQLYLQTNDIIAFDGINPHGSWNNTNKWRYTINMDLKAEYWNV